MIARNRTDLIKELSADLQPVLPRNGFLTPVIIWFIVSWAYITTLGLYLGSLRKGALESLLTSPQFAIESSIGLISAALFCIVALQESIPGLRNQWLVKLSYFSVILWLSCYVVGLSYPAFEPSLIGKRAHCVLEAYIYSIPPLSVGYFVIYRRFPLNSIRAGLFLGISAGLLPALFMQFACLYDPLHTLTHHIGPAVVTIVAGIILGILFKKIKPPL